ncbi:ABC transporter ATP-binding protein [Odoribacter splanchnicus]|uniref:ABC transporter ATP-binding protein n=1 Tax=Odoribacter splanchnicus TaxID=28118 RepID=UPI000B39B169|nr:ABC transporter ATP-binding protein [Odoribacter splanchnicus]OUN92841.1 ABC transporter ATP-binding protein [Odoribacter splanchnicus]
MQDNIIECQNLTHYYGKRLIYENLSFQVPRGRILGLLGKNGTGKTTTINILSGYLQPHSGECRIFGENIRNMNPQTRQRMALLIEGHVQYTFMTIKEIERFYSAFFPAWNKDAYYELMHKLKVAPGQKISRMSCGQRSQVALGLILAQNAELLVLDDFSLGLDPGYRRLFIEYLKEYAKAESKTIFLTSHIIQDMERLIDDCIIMDYGKILIQKPVNDLLNTFTRYRFTTRSGEVQLPADSQLYNTSVIRGHAETYSFQDMEYVKQWLEQNGIPHTSLSAEKMNLEDVFIGLTGKY